MSQAPGEPAVVLDCMLAAARVVAGPVPLLDTTYSVTKSEYACRWCACGERLQGFYYYYYYYYYPSLWTRPWQAVIVASARLRLRNRSVDRTNRVSSRTALASITEGGSRSLNSELGT